MQKQCVENLSTWKKMSDERKKKREEREKQAQKNPATKSPEEEDCSQDENELKSEVRM